MNRNVMFAALAGVVLLAAIPAAAVLTSSTAVVNTGRLNVREGPAVGYRAVSTVSQWETVELLGRLPDTSWVQVRTAAGQVGWVSTLYLLPNMNMYELPIAATTIEPYAYVSTGRLNLRTGPGTTYPIAMTLTQYDTVSVVGKSPDGNWLLVRWNSALGWANAGFVVNSGINAYAPVFNPATTTVAPPAGPVPHYGTGISIPPALNVYQGAGGEAVVTTLASGTTFLLTGRNASTSWIQIALPTGAVGWVSAGEIGASIYLTDLPVLAQ
jgi:uncharacterized protein YgiM (DUF1202 family)